MIRHRIGEGICAAEVEAGLVGEGSIGTEGQDALSSGSAQCRCEEPAGRICIAVIGQHTIGCIHDEVDIFIGAVGVIDDQHGMMRAHAFMQVAQPVCADPVGAVDHLRVARLTPIGRPDRNVIRVHAEMLEAFLNRDADRTATPPQSDQEVRPETGLVNVGGQPERVEQEVVGCDEALVHCRHVALSLFWGRCNACTIAGNIITIIRPPNG